MRKFFLVMMLAALIFTATACSVQPISQPTDQSTNTSGYYWTINPGTIETNWIYAPKAANWTYHERSDTESEYRQKLGDVAKRLWNLNKTVAGDIYGENEYELVKPGTYRLEASEQGKFYIVDYEAFRSWEAGDIVDAIRIWYVFIDNNNVAHCYEYTLRHDSDLDGGILRNPGPNQKLNVHIINPETSYYRPRNLNIFLYLSSSDTSN